jgi:hypothetical protein
MTRENQDLHGSIEKEKKARKANAQKQKRYRESMKAQGYHTRLVWEKPLESGWVRAAAPVIRECSLNTVRDNPAVREVLENLSFTFISDCKKKEIPKEAWEPVYRNIQALLNVSSTK